MDMGDDMDDYGMGQDELEPIGIALADQDLDNGFSSKRYQTETLSYSP